MTRFRRAAIWAATALLPLASPVAAGDVGFPGVPTPSFSLRGSVSVGYTDRQLNGKDSSGQPFLDSLRRFVIMGKLSMLPTDWLEFGFSIGGADARRPLTGYRGQLGVGAGGFVHVHPLLQEDFGINLTMGGGSAFFRSDGDIQGNAPGTRTQTSLRERSYFAHILLSRRMNAWNVYGGPVWNLADIKQNVVPAGEPQLRNVKGNSQFGMVVGIDYFVTPLVFFSIEGRNFHEDSIAGAIGMLIQPHRNSDG